MDILQRRTQKMERIKKSEEVLAVQITEKEFVKIAAQVCSDVFNEKVNDDVTPAHMCVIIPMECTKFTAKLMKRLFNTNEESEEKKDA